MQQRKRYQIVQQNTIKNLEEKVNVILNDAPAYEPSGQPFQSDYGMWNQVIFWKETE